MQLFPNPNIGLFMLMTAALLQFEYLEDAERCLAAGMNAHLAKPIEIEKLKHAISVTCFTKKR